MVNTGIEKTQAGSTVYWDERQPDAIKRVRVVCRCGLDRYIQYKRGMSGLCRNCAQIEAQNHLPRGADHHCWQGGFRRRCGYVWRLVRLLAPEDQEIVGSMQSKGYVAEHRLVVARSLGRSLITGEIVHHINGVKDDNRLENLELLDRRSHGTAHQDALAEIERLQQILDAHGIEH